jgi:hypothetical protein
MTTCANPSIITWARERNGFTVEGLAQIMKIDPDEIRLRESARGLDERELVTLFFQEGFFSVLGYGRVG